MVSQVREGSRVDIRRRLEMAVRGGVLRPWEVARVEALPLRGQRLACRLVIAPRWRRKRMRLVIGVVAVVGLSLALALTGCATPAQPVSFNSHPAGARVLINGEDQGETPLTRDLAVQGGTKVRIEKPGYVPYERTLATGVGVQEHGVFKTLVPRLESQVDVVLQPVR